MFRMYRIQAKVPRPFHETGYIHMFNFSPRKAPLGWPKAEDVYTV